MMTVGELLSILSTLPPELPVMVSGYEYGLEDLEPSKVRRSRVALNANQDVGCNGPHQEFEGDTFYNPYQETGGVTPDAVNALLLVRRGA